MRIFLIIVAFLTVTVDLFSQISFNESISKADSLSVELFWNTFRSSIQQKNKQKLASLFQFPFYCHQCLDYVQANDSYDATVKVSKKLFLDSVYKLFFDIPTLNELTKNICSDTMIFHRISDSKVKSGWMFSYAIISPSKEYEGVQGFIYLKKRKGKFIIDGLDTVP